MTKAKISEYDAVAANNTDVNGVNIAENCPPSGMNNMGREIMAALKRFQTGSDSDGVTVGGNLVVSGSSTLSTTSISSADINAGTIDGTAIGGASAAAGSFTTLGASSTATLNTLSSSGATLTGGTINGIAIGGSTPAAGSFTTLNTSGQVVFNDAGADVDFRVESDTDADAFFLDGGTGAIGLGVTPNAWAPVYGKALQINNRGAALFSPSTSWTSGFSLYGFNNTYIASDATYKYSSTGAAGFLNIANDTLSFLNAASGTAGNTIIWSERMHIDASGNVLVGGTTPVETFAGVPTIQGVTNCIIVNKRNTTGSASQIRFHNPNGNVGDISTSGSSTVYATASDYRLKENVAPMTGALAKVLELNPVTYTWKVDGSAGEGFIAHEIQEVAPYAVSGEKDGEEMQGVDYGKITPLLTAALQEAIAEIKSLKARVAELEAK